MNDIAVANSGLLREYSLVDPRVRNLMMAVKQWAKEFKLNSAKDNFISSYAWINLVVFYLQWLGFIPNLQNRDLMDVVGVIPNPKGNYWHFVNKLDTCTLKWDQVKKARAWKVPAKLQDLPVSALLYGFFEFYSRRFPSGLFAISIKQGNISVPKLSFRKRSLFFCIEDPFETFDSHCPHDLGTPAGESAVRDIMTFLRGGEAHLRGVLHGESKGDRMWPEPPFTEPEAVRKTKNPQFSRFVPHMATNRGNNSNQAEEENRARRIPTGGQNTSQSNDRHEVKQGRKNYQKRRPPPKNSRKPSRDGDKNPRTPSGADEFGKPIASRKRVIAKPLSEKAKVNIGRKVQENPQDQGNNQKKKERGRNRRGGKSAPNRKKSPSQTKPS